jgi:nucleoside triphosphate diphosphatase
LSEATAALATLLELMRRLRDPQTGCPWDRVQTLASIAPHTIEEAYELQDAITQAEPRAIADELGDLLFQVVFHARMAEEQGWFDFAAVARGISAKLQRRHPHLFGEEKLADLADLNVQWERGKRAERAAHGQSGVLAGVAVALPALIRASKLGKRAASVGFDWPDASGARTKLNEELAEFDASVRDGDQAAMADELGDVLLSLTSVARHHGINPEQSLRQANLKFERRFANMEQLLAARQLVLEALGPEQWDALWNEAKLLT